ncbi:hypothetical protein IT402_01825, partial [Candidatus Nomurabacteria bacterium]|nr:hypothetical protein [Candidatus Nomurabacteria bacterium]
VGIVSTGNHNLWQKKAWQAVFLNNNQVYFGKIQKINRNTLVLTDIYYLQASESLASPDDTNSKLNLVKLGSEVHGPKDKMTINRSNILFWEDLKDNSRIVKVINQLLK